VTDTFVDTSALIALLDDTDEHFDRAIRWLDEAVTDRDEHLVTHTYVVVEAIAVAHRRFGAGAVRALIDHGFETVPA
jgi:predicted nucleic acid-binding protein